MRKWMTVILLSIFTLPAFCTEQTFNNAPILDVMCSKDRKVAANPDAHTKECALECKGAGFGIVTSDHKFLKFDSAGNERVLAQLKNSKKQDHLRVDVSGDVQGDTLKVKSIRLL